MHNVDKRDSSLPALELHSVAVKVDTHGVVGVHHNLVDEGLHSLVEISKEKVLI